MYPLQLDTLPWETHSRHKTEQFITQFAIGDKKKFGYGEIALATAGEQAQTSKPHGRALSTTSFNPLNTQKVQVLVDGMTQICLKLEMEIWLSLNNKLISLYGALLKPHSFSEMTFQTPEPQYWLSFQIQDLLPLTKTHMESKLYVPWTATLISKFSPHIKLETAHTGEFSLSTGMTTLLNQLC